MHGSMFDEIVLMANMKRCNLTVKQAIDAMKEYRHKLDFENALDEAFNSDVIGNWKDDDVP